LREKQHACCHKAPKAARTERELTHLVGGITENHLMVTVAHEMAHYVQYRYAQRVPRFKGKWQKPHGEAFCTIYRYLRRDLVNETVTARLKL